MENKKVINNVKHNLGVVYNKGTFNNFPENILDQIKLLIENNHQKDEKIKILEAELNLLRK